MSPSPPVTTGRVLSVWWPLAASWLLMGIEGPLLAMAVARLPNPDPQLAAWGGIVFPVALLIEAPIIMLLAASTALSRDRASHAKLLRFAHVAGFALTLVHAAVAFTPLYDLVVVRLLEAPEATVEHGRLGLRILLPWTWAIAFRRFQQGVFIRAGKSRMVGVGTVVRLIANASVLGIGLLTGAASGMVVGALAVSVGVVAEAVFVGLAVRGDVAALPARDTSAPPLDRARFLRFYLPLAATPLIWLVIHPLGAAAMGRMPESLDSLAVWTPAYGLIFVFRSLGYAFNEVVVALAGERGAIPALRRFAWMLGGGAALALGAIAFTPLAQVWFRDVTALSPRLVPLATTAVAVGMFMPGYAAIQNWYQGLLVHASRTRAVTEAMTLNLLLIAVGLGLGVALQPEVGLYYTISTFTVAGTLQTAYLAWRARGPLRALEPRPA